MAARRQLRAVVFDCDGVLVESEFLAWQAWREVLSTYGYVVTDADVTALLGRTADEILDYFVGRAGIADRAGVMALVGDTMASLFDDQLQCYSDAVSLLIEARSRGLRIAVASSSDRDRVRGCLKVTGVAHLIEVVVAGDDVLKGKPAPDVYTQAAHRLGVDPGDCIAVEDSPIGVAAALAAEMLVVAVVRQHTDREGVAGASLVVEELSSGVLDRVWARS